MVGALMRSAQSMGRARSKGDASRLAALYAIAEVPGRSPKTISEALGVHASSVTRQIQALEEEGHVKVTVDPKDRRSCRVRLTAAGRAEIARLQEVGLQRFASFVAKWDVGEVRELARLLVKLEESKAAVNTAPKPARAHWREKQ
jgi:DNA-binding MarR family transcriptional regulator